GEGSLLERVREFLRGDLGEIVTDLRVLLVTCPKVFGYGFNPVSFYLCFDPQDELKAVIAEVNNTFGERHLYLLETESASREGQAWVFSTPKVFHVSPFFSREGEYRFRLSYSENRFDVSIDLWQHGKRVIHTKVSADSTPLDTAGLRNSLLRYPLVRLLTYPRILKEAAVLFYLKKAQLWYRPTPCDSHTHTVRKLSFREKFGQRVLHSMLTRMKVGKLRIRFHDGTWETYGGQVPGTECQIVVRDPAFYRSTVFGGDVGFGEAYTRGEWDSPDVTRVIECLIENREGMGDYRIPFASLVHSCNRLYHFFRRNSLRKSRRNISDHYDLGNNLFAKFLDPSMTYSCAFYEDESTSLEQAQDAKLGMILSRAEIRDGDRVLEIGSGWGSFVLAAARSRNCQLATTT
ncbi:MAG: DUF1365 family protein, partial [Candidatus Omnitrophica bacterium]|nr:DUF1365 family protein [Candidatus Omnitrophota bacterium]